MLALNLQSLNLPSVEAEAGATMQPDQSAALLVTVLLL